MVLDRVRRDVERLGDLLRRAAAQHETCHLPLSGRQAVGLSDQARDLGFPSSADDDRDSPARIVVEQRRVHPEPAAATRRQSDTGDLVGPAVG